MADRNQQVYEMVEQELHANPETSTDDLYEKAKKLDSGIAKLTLRQFNGRYPLQVKRQMNKENGTTTKKTRKPRKQSQPKAEAKVEPKAESTPTPAPASVEVTINGNATAVRGTLLNMVHDLTHVSDMSALDLIAFIDRYTHEIVEAVEA